MRLLPGQLYSRLSDADIIYSDSDIRHRYYYILGVVGNEGDDGDQDTICYFSLLMSSDTIHEIERGATMKSHVIYHDVLSDYLCASGYVLVDVGDTTWVSEI